ncbi:hypothetical protein [Humibacillus xanthopallidus]|uniref:Uncharacterized protein n=1 Tax=Humibacillus xanthopallidus TaxID=412689 RepID=A0A543HZT0_9MICO|nr:hypothetical protein [Humibacillus xanthopallidus]TQM63847.1 hypothetical protein FBY41_0201 [Humibacillus xanthopallidus]
MTVTPPATWSLSTRWPVTLLPVRLETRFSGSALKVRIYPDTVHVDAHEVDLTSDEILRGRDYWTAMWRAGGNGQREREAWDRLLGDVGTAERARWVARVLEPAPDGRPTSPLPVDAPVSPVFPAVEPAEAWTRPPLARALPTRWWAMATRDGSPPAYGMSSEVREELAVGPGPGQGEVPTDDELPPVPSALDWLVDFDAACGAGMGLVIEPLPAAMLEGGIDRLVVVGVDETATPQQGGATLAQLLEAHAADDGLALLTPGTATNTTDDVRSGYDSGSPSEMLAARVTVTDAAPGRGLAGDRLASALGVGLAGGADGPDRLRDVPVRQTAPTALGRAAGGGSADAARAADMRRALWPGTLGYAMRHLLDVPTGGVSAAAQEPGVRRHFVDWVCADGPLPGLRIGRQPYAVLPALAFDRYVRREAGNHADGISLLRALRDHVWRPSLDNVPRILAPEVALARGLPVQDPGEVLLDILATDARPRSVAARSLLGPDYVASLWRFAKFRLADDWQERLAAVAGPLLAELGRPAASEGLLARGVYATDAFPLHTPFVDAPTTAPVAQWLTTLSGPLSPTTLAAQTGPGGVRVPLLYRLARASLLAEHSAAADDASRRYGIPAARTRDGQELHNILPADVVPTFAERLAPAVPGWPSLEAALTESSSTFPPATGVRDVRAALASLRSASASDLERHLGGVLGLASYRLDAWITSYATERLATIRAAEPAGTHLGGYGVLVDLLPDGPAPQQTEPVADEPLPLTRTPGAGHVLSPSIAHATTAAVLRSGFRARGAGPDNPLAVELTSRRVRLATGVLQGIREGQPLPALLGYLFERALHEHPREFLDRFLPRLRELAPSEATEVRADGSLRRTELPGGVVDGLALLRRRPTLPWGDGLPAASATDADHVALDEVLDVLEDAVDAVHDALLAESVHHALQGNMARAAASLDTVSRGVVPPPAELDVAATPTSGLVVRHRLLVLSNGQSASRAEFPANPATTSLRAMASPELDAIASALLPSTGRVFVRLVWTSPEGVTHVQARQLSALFLAAIDCVMMPPRGPEPSGGELEQRIALDAWTVAPSDVTPEWSLRLDFGRDPAWPADRLGVGEFLTAVAGVRALLLQSRPVVASDLEPGAPTDGLVDHQHILNRAEAVTVALTAAAHDLETGDESTRRAALLVAAGVGIIGAVPPPRLARHAEAVVEAAARTRKALLERLAAAAAVLAGEATADRQRRRLAALVGEDLPVLPRVSHPEQPDLAASLAASTALQGGDPWASSAWLARAARVREGADRLQTALIGADALEAPAATLVSPTLRVAQLPHVPGDLWRALPRSADTPGEGLAGFVVAAPMGLDPLAPVCGLLVDEWTETVPDERRTAAVAFEYDAPGSAPPQSLLVAVPPDASPTWTPAVLFDTVSETIDLARLRMVDPAALDRIGQFLPGLYFPVNVARAVPTTDFTPDAAPV